MALLKNQNGCKTETSKGDKSFAVEELSSVHHRLRISKEIIGMDACHILSLHRNITCQTAPDGELDNDVVCPVVFMLSGLAWYNSPFYPSGCKIISEVVR